MMNRRGIIGIMRFFDFVAVRRMDCKRRICSIFFSGRAGKIVLFAIISGIVFAEGGDVFGQRQRNNRVQQRREQIIQSNREREQQARDARITRENAVPVPKPAMLNVDVQAAISGENFPSFAEARAASAERIEDGSELWLYIRFNGKLGDYAYAVRDPEIGGPVRYLMFLDVGPQNDSTVQARFLLEFANSDLAKSELKINLAPGRPGRNASTPVLLFVAGNRGPGLWKNELRLSNSIEVIRPREQNLAIAPVIFDFTNGSAGYRTMLENYDSIILRGTTDAAQLPIPGAFYSLPLKTRIISMLRGEGIVPARFFFSGDTWLELSTFEGSPARLRRIFAAFTYRRGSGCFYGFAEIVERFNFDAGQFGEANITPQLGFPLSCKMI